MAPCDSFLSHGTYVLLNARGGTALDLAGGTGKVVGYPVHYRVNQQVCVMFTTKCANTHGIEQLAHTARSGISSVRGRMGDRMLPQVERRQAA